MTSTTHAGMGLEFTAECWDSLRIREVAPHKH